MSFAPKHILLPVAVELEDDFDLAIYALESACDIAERFKADISLLYVIPPTYAQTTQFDVNSDVYRAFSLVLKARLGRGQEQLTELSKRAAARKIKTHKEVLETEETIAEAICAQASQKAADLIVIGSHARKGVKRLLLGSVAARVSNLSTVPVLLLRR